jgi:hypothetical protein
MAQRATVSARPWGRAALGGGRPGRPTANATFQFAGSPDRLSPEAQQLIAAQRWGERRGRDKPETAPQNRSISSGADISASRGLQRSERRFAGEAAPFSSGGAAANPFA